MRCEIMRRVPDGCKGVGRPVGPKFPVRGKPRQACPTATVLERPGSARTSLYIECCSWRNLDRCHRCARDNAACTPEVRHEQSFGAKRSARIMMSTHCSLLISPGPSKATPMTSAFLSAFIFSAGLISGYALRAWRVQRSPARSSRDASRRTAGPTPTTTFGHARRAF